MYFLYVYSFRYLAGKFLDGHSTTLITLMTALGLYREAQPLLVSNRQQMGDRVFKSSHIAPYSTNLAFVLYACRPATVNATNTFKLQLLVNEKAKMIPGCNAMLCPYDEVREMHADLINDCDLEEICSGPFKSKDDSSAVCYSLNLGLLTLVLIIKLLV